MKTLPQPIFSLTFVYQTLASMTRRRIPNVSHAPNADDHQHGPTEFGYVTHLANSIGLSVNHIPATEEILSNGDQSPLTEDEGHVTARLLMFRREAAWIGEHMCV